MTGVIISLMYEVVQIREAELRARSKEEELHAMAQELNRLKHVEAKLRAKEEEVNALKQELANTMSECIFWCHFHRRTPLIWPEFFRKWCYDVSYSLWEPTRVPLSTSRPAAAEGVTVCSALPASILDWAVGYDVQYCIVLSCIIFHFYSLLLFLHSCLKQIFWDECHEVHH